MYGQQGYASYRPGNIGRNQSRLYSSAPGGVQHVERTQQVPFRMQVLDETHFPEADDFEPAAIDVGSLGNFQHPTPCSRFSAAAHPGRPLADIRYVSYQRPLSYIPIVEVCFQQSSLQ